MTTLIIGCGYVGGRLLQRLRSAELCPWGVSRNPPHGQGILQADVTDPDSLLSLPDDVSSIVYAVSPGAREDEAYRRAFPQGIANVLHRYPSARLLFVSSTAVYGASAGQDVTDTSPADAAVFSAVRLREAEELVLRASNANLVLRASGIYGPGRNRLLSRLVHEDLDEVARETWTNRIHVDDLVGVLCWALPDPGLAGVLLVSDLAPAQLGQMQDYVRSFPRISERLPQLGLGATRVGGTNRRLRPRRLQASDYHYVFPTFREGYRSIIEALP